jgi:hypothetical protein
MVRRVYATSTNRSITDWGRLPPPPQPVSPVIEVYDSTPRRGAKHGTRCPW